MYITLKYKISYRQIMRLFAYTKKNLKKPDDSYCSQSTTNGSLGPEDQKVKGGEIPTIKNVYLQTIDQQNV